MYPFLAGSTTWCLTHGALRSYEICRRCYTETGVRFLKPMEPKPVGELVAVLNSKAAHIPELYPLRETIEAIAARMDALLKEVSPLVAYWRLEKKIDSGYCELEFGIRDVPSPDNACLLWRRFSRFVASTMWLNRAASDIEEMFARSDLRSACHYEAVPNGVLIRETNFQGVPHHVEEASNAEEEVGSQAGQEVGSQAGQEGGKEASYGEGQ